MNTGITDKFNNHKERFYNVCNVDVFRKISNIGYPSIELEIKKEYRFILDFINELNYSKEISKEINKWIEELEERIKLHEEYKSKLNNKISNYLKALLLDFKLIKLKNKDHGKAFTIKSRLPKVTNENKSIMERREIAILMYLLRRNKIFNKDVSDKLLSECMGALAGFSEKHLREDYLQLKSHREKISNHNIVKLKEVLSNILYDMDKQLAEI